MMEEANKVGLKVVGHVPVAVGLEHALESRQDEITHVEEYWRFTPNDYSDEVVARYTELTVAAGTWTLPTLSTYQNIIDQFLDVDAVLNRDEVRYIDPAIHAFWAPRTNRYVGANKNPEASAARVKSFEPVMDFARRLVKSLYEAGVPLMSGTDALNPMSMPGWALHEELVEFVNAGIPPLEALHAATQRTAQFMEESKEWGQIAPGRRADLVLLSANPLEDIANTQLIEGVMTRGHCLQAEEIQTRLALILFT